MIKYILLFTLLINMIINPLLSSNSEEASLPEIRHRAIQLQNHPLENINDASSLSTYPLGNGNALNWDNADEFAEQLDQGFFKGNSKKSRLAGTLAGVIGAVVPYASCGYVINNIGNFLHVPLSGPLENFMIAGITVTTTPVFAQQFYSSGQKMVSYIFKEEPFQDPDSLVELIHKNKSHYALKGSLLLSAGINALIPTLLMHAAEKDFPMFFAFTAFPFYGAWLENNYKVGSSNLDYLFSRYQYTSKTNFQKRQILKNKLLAFKEEITRDNVLVSNLYEMIEAQRVHNFKAQDGFPFCFSGLFLRDAVRLEDEGELINFKVDVENDPHSAFDNAMDWGSSFLTGASTYAKYSITQSVLESFLKEVMDEEKAFIFSATLASFEALHRLTTSHYTQTQTLQSLKNLFRAPQNFTIVRKAGSVLSAVNASLFSLPYVVAGLDIFSEFSTLSKVAILGPVFATDYLYYNNFFSKNYNRFINNATTLKKENTNIILQRAHLTKHADKALKYVDQFKEEPIENLYKIIMKGV